MTIVSTPPDPTAAETASGPNAALTPAGRRWTTEQPPWVGGLIGGAVIVALWWIASQTLYPDTHAIPSPWAVVEHFGDSDDWRALKNNFTPTVQAALWGYLWGNLLAVIAAMLVLVVPFLEEVVNQIAIITYCLPPVAIGPIIVVIAGQDHPQAAPIVLASLAPFFTTVVGCLLGLRSASRTSLDLVAAYGGSPLTQLRKVRIISALPNLFAALKIAAPAAFLGAVLAEFLGGGGDNSVGQALIAANSTGDASRLWYLALVSGLVAGVGYLIVGFVARLVTPWTSAPVAGAK